ncbi:MAG: hypothetical protein HY962_15010 [Ignavibacteriae bacterium]|nr:hypothetical protein [Ignavibacteriota bacterium]
MIVLLLAGCGKDKNEDGIVAPQDGLRITSVHATTAWPRDSIVLSGQLPPNPGLIRVLFEVGGVLAPDTALPLWYTPTTGFAIRIPVAAMHWTQPVTVVLLCDAARFRAPSAIEIMHMPPYRALQWKVSGVVARVQITDWIDVDGVRTEKTKDSVMTIPDFSSTAYGSNTIAVNDTQRTFADSVTSQPYQVPPYTLMLQGYFSTPRRLGRLYGYSATYTVTGRPRLILSTTIATLTIHDVPLAEAAPWLDTVTKLNHDQFTACAPSLSYRAEYWNYINGGLLNGGRLITLTEVLSYVPGTVCTIVAWK